jgi:hypothetical protein
MALARLMVESLVVVYARRRLCFFSNRSFQNFFLPFQSAI